MLIPYNTDAPIYHFPFVTIGLIVANFVVYILAIRHGGSFFSGPTEGEVFKYGAIPYAILHPGIHCAVVAPASNPTAIETLCNTHLLNQSHIGAQNLLPSWETIFTGMFMHASILHIGGNMIFLWIFGNNVENAMGPVKYLIFYIVGGLAAFALQLAVGPGSTTPTLGASGAIAAVLGGYSVLYPRARILSLVFILQYAVLDRFRIVGVRPDFLLGLAIVAAVVAGPERGALVGFAGGVLVDLFVNTPFGLSALVACVVASIAGWVIAALGANQRWIVVALTAAGSVAAVISWAVLATVLGLAGLLGTHLLTIALVTATCNAALAVPFAAAARWVFAGEIAAARSTAPRGFAA